MVETKHYVKLLFPGVIVSETSTEEVEEKDPSKIEVSDTCYGFYFFDRTEITVEGETLKGKAKNHSKTYYPDGKVFTLEEVKQNFPEATILISNIECNGWDRIVKTRMGNFQPFDEEKAVLWVM